MGHRIVQQAFTLMGVLGLATASPGWAWDCATYVWAYRETCPWLPFALQRILHPSGTPPARWLCRPLDPTTLTHLPRVLETWARDAPLRFYHTGNLHEMVNTFIESARWILFLHDPAMARTVRPPIRQAFHAYVRRHLKEIPPVFYGYEDPVLEREAWTVWLQEIQRETKQAAQVLAHPQRFRLPSDPADWHRLDFRSTAFGIASLRLRWGITRVVRFWIHVWRKGHGSLRGLPTLNPGEPYYLTDSKCP